MAKQKPLPPNPYYKHFSRQLPTPDHWAGNFTDANGGEAAQGSFSLLFGGRWITPCVRLVFSGNDDHMMGRWINCKTYEEALGLYQSWCEWLSRLAFVDHKLLEANGFEWEN